MSQQITVEAAWEKYRKQCWAHVDPNSEQIKSIKQVWFCAWFDSLVTLQDIVGGENVSEDDGVKILSSLLDETKTFIKADIERSIKLGRVGFPTQGAPQ